jgi:ABC-type molybdate transport system substrate-binding protein
MIDYGSDDLSTVMTTLNTNSSPLVNKGALDTGTVYKSMDIDKSDISGFPFFDDTTVVNTVKYNLVTPFKPFDKLGNNFDVLCYKY